MEVTRWLWRDCHPVMHWEPSLAFCRSHTDESDLWQRRVKDTGRAEGWGLGREAEPAQGGLYPLLDLLFRSPNSEPRTKRVPSVSLEGV